MPNMKQNATMADVAEYITEAENISGTYRLRLLAAVRRCKRLLQYKQAPLDLIPADLVAFDKLWGTGRVTQIPNGFKTAAHLLTWRSEARSALTKFLGGDQATEKVIDPEDDWTELKRDLEANSGIADVQLIGVEQIAQRARSSGTLPKDVTPEWLKEHYKSFEATSKRRSFKLGWELIEKNRASVTSIPLPGLLPFPPLRLDRNVAARLPLPPTLAAEMAAVTTRLLKGKSGGHRGKHRKTVKGNTVALYCRSISYLHTAGVALETFGSDEDIGLLDLANPDLFEEVIEAELDGTMPWKKLTARTLNGYMAGAKAVIKHAGHDVVAVGKLVKEFKAFSDAYEMSEARRQWCKDFLHDRHRQRAFFWLPTTCHTRAKPMIANYHDLNPTKQKQAIAWAIAAAAAAILTSLPLRVRSLISLEIAGETSTVNVRGKGRNVPVNIAGSIVKNRHVFDDASLTPKPGGSPKDILTWFADEVRPLILHGGISNRLRNSDLLFCGIGYERMRTIWCDATLAAGVDMTPHQVRHAIATVMANEDDADYSLIAALLGITEATVRKNYVFIDKAKKHEKGQSELARIQNNILSKKLPELMRKPVVGEW